MEATATRRIVKGTNDNIPFRASIASWYRFRRGMTNLNGKCSQWADYSGNSRPLLQATVANQPTFDSSGGLIFNGTAAFMVATYTLPQPITVYILFRQISWATNAVILDGVTADSKLTQSASTPQITANAGSSLTASSTIPVSATQFGVACAVFNGATSVYQAGAGGPSSTITGNAGTNSAGGITVGAARAGNNFANINVREIAVYSLAHDAPTRLQVMRYLSKIYSSVGGMM